MIVADMADGFRAFCHIFVLIYNGLTFCCRCVCILHVIHGQSFLHNGIILEFTGCTNKGYDFAI